MPPFSFKASCDPTRPKTSEVKDNDKGEKEINKRNLWEEPMDVSKL